MPKAKTTASSPLDVMTPIQRQLHQILNGRPELVSILSDDYGRVFGDMLVAVAPFGFAVMRMTLTSGLTYYGEPPKSGKWHPKFSEAFRSVNPASPRFVPSTLLTLAAKETEKEGRQNSASRVRFASLTSDTTDCVAELIMVAPKAAPGQSPMDKPKHLTPVPLVPPNTTNPLAALDGLVGINEPAVVLVEDFHPFLTAQYPLVATRLREIAQMLNRREHVPVIIVMVGPTRVIPENMRGSTITVDYPLPAEDEIGEMVDTFAARAETQGYAVKLTRPSHANIRNALLGLTARSARTAISQAVARTGAFDDSLLPHLAQERKHLFESIAGNAAEFLPPPKLFQLAGFENFKAAAELDAKAVASGNDRAPVSRGYFLIGTPGTGKSDAALLLSATTGLPTIKVPIGALGGSDASKVGAMSGAMRAILQGARALRKCILLFDDVLKAVDSTDNAKRGGGTVEFLRAVQVLLDWTEHREGQIIIFFTGNSGDLVVAPPEGLIERIPVYNRFVTRKPGVETRQQIFSIKLAESGYEPQEFNLAALAQNTDGAVGRDIRDFIEAGVRLAFARDQQMNPGHILEVIAACQDDTDMEQIGDYRFKHIDATPPQAAPQFVERRTDDDAPLLSLIADHQFQEAS